jgi:hypothetical protein
MLASLRVMPGSKQFGRKINMTDWIPFVEGEYLVEQAFMISPDNRAVAVEDAVIEIFAGPQGRRYLKGSGRIRNVLLVELLEDHDDLDLILDLGDGFKYRLRKPEFQSGKFFSPVAKSTFRFRPAEPWEKISSTDFVQLMSKLRIAGG